MPTLPPPLSSPCPTACVPVAQRREDDDLARAIAASLADDPFSTSPSLGTAAQAQHAVPRPEHSDAATAEAIQMGFDAEQVARVQAQHRFTTTDRLVEHLLSGDGGPATAATGTAAVPGARVGSTATRSEPDTHGDAALAAAIHASLNGIRQETPSGRPSLGISRSPNSVTTGSGGGAAPDPAHAMRSLVIGTLRGDPVARADLRSELEALNRGKTASDRLVYFLLENCQMEKISKLPEDIIPIWMQYLGHAPGQPSLSNLIMVEGQLGKQGSKNWSTSGWKQKWFVLTDGMLCYYNKLQDKMDGKPPKAKVAVSDIIRLQMVDIDVSGKDFSFEVVTEGDLPNWKLHACISPDMSESQLYFGRWVSAVEEAIRGARELDAAFRSAKPPRYWQDLDEQLESPKISASRTSDVGSEAGMRRHRRGESADSIGSAGGEFSFNPRGGGASSDTADPFGSSPAASPSTTPAPAPPDLLGELLGSGPAVVTQVARGSTDPFDTILFEPSGPPAGYAAASGSSLPGVSVHPSSYVATATPIPLNHAASPPLMTPSPVAATLGHVGHGAAPGLSTLAGANPFLSNMGSGGQRPLPASLFTPGPPTAQATGAAATKNPFRTSPMQMASPAASVKNPFLSLETTAWKGAAQPGAAKQAAVTATPMQATPMQAPASATGTPVTGNWDSIAANASMLPPTVSTRTATAALPATSVLLTQQTDAISQLQGQQPQQPNFEGAMTGGAAVPVMLMHK